MVNAKFSTITVEIEQKLYTLLTNIIHAIVKKMNTINRVWLRDIFYFIQVKRKRKK